MIISSAVSEATSKATWNTIMFAMLFLLCERGVLNGRDAVRTSAKALADQLPDARFRYLFRAVDGENALLHWTAQSAKARVDFGVDTFVIRDSRIVLQTVSYEIKPAS